MAAVDAGELDRADQAAGEALAAAPGDGHVLHEANLLLGRVALARGDVAGGRQHLRAAGATDGSPGLNTFGPDFTLATALLAAGERDAVVAYLEACKRFWEGRTELLADWQRRIARGETPLLDRIADVLED